MFLEQYASELMTFLSGIAGIVIGVVSGRKREKANVQELEVRITQKLLKIMMTDVVEPLREELAIAREELNNFKNAFKKRFICRNNANCPISVELQKQTNSSNARNKQQHSAHRQRAPDTEDHNETFDGSGIDSNDDAEPP